MPVWYADCATSGNPAGSRDREGTALMALMAHRRGRQGASTAGRCEGDFERYSTKGGDNGKYASARVS
jgi:hypothetical protein